MSEQQPVWTPPSSSGGENLSADVERTTGADKMALVALAVSLTTIMSCIPVVNTCLIPLAPLVVGIIALTQAKNAANPDRARTYGWVATGIGIFILLAVIVVIFLYGAMFMSAMNQMEELR